MTPTFKNPVRSAALAVVCLLAAARGELTLAQDLAPDPYFQPIADKSFPLMPPVILRSIREDRDGNIWFASFGGPIRYDGKTFTNFGEEAGLPGQRIFSLLVDKSGALWFGTVLSGASRYDGKSFTRFTTKEGLSGNGVFQIFEDRDGAIWLATGQGVSRYDGKTFTNYSTKDGLPDNTVQAIAQDRSGNLWFGSKEGIASYDGKTFTNFAGVAGREFQNIWSIVEDKAGNLWFGGQSGVYRYDGKTGTMLTTKDGLLEDFAGSMIVDKAGNVWFGHGGGATRYDGKAFTHFTQKEGLPSENVYCMLEDRDGRIWFGSAGYGASRYDGKTFTSFSAPSLRSAEPRKVPGLGLTLMPVPAGTMGSPERQEKGSGLDSLVLEGHELHASLRTRQPDHRNRHLPAGVLPPGNPHLSTDAAFVEAIAHNASQGLLGGEGIRSVLYALYVGGGERELGFYGVEAESVAEANRREDVMREILANNVRIDRMRVHRAGLVLLVVWHDGVSPECWEAVNAKVVERLVAP